MSQPEPRAPDRQLGRQLARKLFDAGVAAADPAAAVARHLRCEGEQLVLADAAGDGERRGDWPRVHLIAFGKAALAMAEAALAAIPAERLAGPAIVVSNAENLRQLPGVAVHAAGHPVPDEGGLAAARAVAERVAAAAAGELVLVLLSGGGSALLPLPADGLTLADKIATTRELLACGADIGEMNCVRKHLSALKGGGLARLAAPADLHALILSDVLGDDLATIASGPTVADPSSYADAVEILRRRGAWERLPESVRTHLRAGAAGQRAETPKPGDALFAGTGHALVGSNAVSLAAMVDAARDAGCAVEIYSQRLEGEARDVAEALAEFAARRLAEGERPRPLAVLAGGETTVTLRGDGLGGRNQEMALAFAAAAQRLALADRWTFLSGGTDGRDGPVDAAGGLVDAGTLARIATAGGDAPALLANNDSYRALGLAGDLLMTGGTGTNVADLQVLLLR